MKRRVLALTATIVIFQFVVSRFAAVGNPSAGNRKVAFVEVRSVSDIKIYEPHHSTVDLVCGQRPGLNDASVVFCAEAAFTGQFLKTFKHMNIAGNHVSRGVFYRGYPCSANTGAFVYYNGKWKFLYKKYVGELKLAGKNGGMGFAQNMIIFNFKKLRLFRKDKPRNIYRALCELKGKLCILESQNLMAYSDYVKELKKLGVKHALYLDMGAGWNYSWYRDAKGSSHVLHPQNQNSMYQTNWIVFRKL